jgi:acyl-CoA synthetase (AMP-forming)/AMP-acid ligase II
MRERLGCPVVVRYASTEVPLAFGTDVDDPPGKVATTVGRALGDVEVEIRSSGGAEPGTGDGTRLGAGATGRVFLRSRGSMRGYWRDPERTAQTLSVDGWIASGDVGRLDADGYLTIVGRVDDAYVRGGYNVYPSEVERALLSHPAVARAAVVGAAAPVIGEVGVAFVVAAPGAPVDAEAVRAWCRRRIADYKVPDLVLLVDDLPVNATYKVDRTALRRLAADAVSRSGRGGG